MFAPSSCFKCDTDITKERVNAGDCISVTQIVLCAFINMHYTYWFDIFNSAFKSLKNLLSISSALRVCKCLCAEAVRRGNQNIFNKSNRHCSVSTNWCTGLPTNHISFWLSVRSDLPNRKWGTLSIAPFPPADEETANSGDKIHIGKLIRCDKSSEAIPMTEITFRSIP